MSNRRRSDPAAVRATWHRDQLAAAANDAALRFAAARATLTATDDMLPGRGHLPPGWLLDRVARADWCPHVGPRQPPGPMILFLNAALVACPRCAAKVIPALDGLADDRCDCCGTAPPDNQFHLTCLRQGGVLAVGHFCAACSARHRG